MVSGVWGRCRLKISACSRSCSILTWRAFSSPTFGFKSKHSVSTSKPFSFLANCLPIFPYPIIPTVFPSSSMPRFSSLLQSPERTSLSAAFSLLNRDRSKPKVCSATALRLPSGAAAKKIPCFSAATRSIFSNPAPILPMNFKFWA